jgi:hypothetical protein
MENNQMKKRKQNRKPLYILLVFIGVFSLFIYMLVKPSLESTAINELNTCLNTEDVKTVFYKYKTDLIESQDFCQAARDKLNSLNLSQSEIVDIKKWLPSKTNNLNVIIVPDLSNRIIDNENNLDQIKRDSVIINAISESFINSVKTKMNSNDKLVIDITDRNQAGGKIGELADTIMYDLSNFKNKINKLYFNDKREQFGSGVSKLYDAAYNFEVENPKGGGADFVSYFSTNLKSKIQKSTLNDNYRNVLIILTDGYLEATKPNGDIISYIKFEPTEIQETSSSRFKELEVYLLEFNRRKSANDLEENRIKRWWYEWLKSMNVKSIDDETAEDDIIIKRMDGYTDVKKKIDEILNKK